MATTILWGVEYKDKSDLMKAIDVAKDMFLKFYPEGETVIDEWILKNIDGTKNKYLEEEISEIVGKLLSDVSNVLCEDVFE